MKNLILLLLFTLSTGIAFGQVICGQVLDKETNEPVNFASVYIDGTFLGTITDKNGEFELDVNQYLGRTLYISAVGYRTASLNTLKKGDYHQIILNKAVYEITEVSIESPSLIKKRRKCMGIFKKEFLGSSKNAEDCIILNEEVITFNYNSDKDTLKAYIRKPLIILNYSLGYQITYYLDKFEYDKVHKTTTFTGNISFNLDLANNNKRRKKLERRRKKTYLGSSKHFFSSLWTNNLRAEGFYVQRVGTAEPLKRNEFIIEDSQGRKYLSFNEDLEISYNYYLSTVNFLHSKAFFDKDGFFEPEAILWYGYMSHSRIADWLPYEYSPKH